jgi:hypothetical protein
MESAQSEWNPGRLRRGTVGIGCALEGSIGRQDYGFIRVVVIVIVDVVVVVVVVVVVDRV